MKTLDEINSDLLLECGTKWVEIYNSLLNQDCTYSEMDLITDFYSDDAVTKAKLDKLKELKYDLMECGYSFDDDTKEEQMERNVTLKKVAQELNDLYQK